MRLGEEFFNRKTVDVAQNLLGKYLVRRIGKKTVAGRIVETEAYCGQKDLACHAAKGFTPRTKVLFGPPGHTYVYFIYGMYYCLNFVTREVGQPEAVLIRGLAIPGADGPGKLCRMLAIGKEQNDLPPGNQELWVEDRGFVVPKRQIEKTKRIGVAYAGVWADKPWRFVLQST